MILVTGGTGFVGRAVLRHLTAAGLRVRTLLKPAQRSPRLPAGVPVDVALAALNDPRGMRAALVGVEAVVHLASAERTGNLQALQRTDVEGTRTLAEACAQAAVRHLVYVSHLGADRESAYAVLRAKALAEEHLRTSGVPYTVLRPGIVFGADDHFTRSLAMMAASVPLVFLLPGDGEALLHPLWIEDLATAIAWTLEDREPTGTALEIGGPEFHSLRQVMALILPAAGLTRIILPTRQPYLRAGAALLRRLMPRPPITPFLLDYLASNRTAGIDSMPRLFGLQPARLESHLDHLRGKNWEWELLARQIAARRAA
ncbi:MAG: NAD(P)H-binding protein [Anaerolineales bacterium]|nr:NAD(P)H-binding protein [Anaerolineales bacterium]